MMMMKKAVSLRDIAQKTGYSIKTVSRAINNHPDVNENTRRKILSVAKKYSYYPNLVAKSLRTRKAYTIGYIVPDITNEFYGKIGITIEKEFRKHGYSLLVSFTEESEENEINSLKLLLAKRVDGIILATVGTTGDFLQEVINRHHIPVVVIDNKAEGIKTNTVLHDNIYGGYVLTKHLLEHAHRRIACVTGPLSETSGKERLEGYTKALIEYNIPIEERFIKVSNWRVHGGFDATMELMGGAGEKPSAVFYANSQMALGAYKAFKKNNVRIPEDVAVVSFDNLDFTDAIDPPLTTLDSVDGDIGRHASELLREIIVNGDGQRIREYLVKAGLCIRKSCGCK
jgi:LacI family transcriptional regulator